MTQNFIVKGTFLFTKAKDDFCVKRNRYLFVKDGKCMDFYETLPEEYQGFPIFDYTDDLIIPGMIDLHLHASQYPVCGRNMDMELLMWLEKYVFREESRYIDAAYARKMYRRFVEDLRKSATTRAVIFATIHKDATLTLMDFMEESGLISYVGKVNMDRNSSDALTEDTQVSLQQTESWVKESLKRYDLTKPVITPRFVPSCSKPLNCGLGKIAERYSLPIQSHLSENTGEIAWVKNLHPEASSYTDVYFREGLLNAHTIMAHCVHLSEDEITLLKKNGVYVAHCPQSNVNLASGIAPIRKYLQNEMKIGLGTDLAGGANISMFRAITDAIQASKLYFALIDKTALPLTVPEAFYMATKGGGSFFGKTGSFERGYDFDALVLDDHALVIEGISEKERLERLLYLGNLHMIKEKYVCGNRLF